MSFRFIKELRDALFPPSFTCDICGKESFDGNLCDQCKKTVIKNNGEVCPICGRKTVRPEICLECKDIPPVYKKAVSPLVYSDGAIILIGKFKNGKGYLKDYFAALMAESVKSIPDSDAIIYVPMTKKSARRRGYNQSKLLAHSLGRIIGIPVIDNALEKTKDTSQQKKLSKKERAKNLKGCFKVINKDVLKGKNILLIDDILTTGATADEAASVLMNAGAARVDLAVIASVEYKTKPEKVIPEQ